MTTITNQEASDLLGGNSEWLEHRRELVDTTRWGDIYSVVFTHPVVGKTYELWYEIGSGDSDYTSADHWGDADGVEVHEVEPVLVSVTEWRRVT